MMNYAALPKPINMLNENQIIVWATHILFTVTFVYMSLVYWKTVTESLLFLICCNVFSGAKGPKHLNYFFNPHI